MAQPAPSVDKKDATSVSVESVGSSVSSAKERPKSTKNPGRKRGKKSFKLKTLFTRELHWVSRKFMVGCLAVGVATMLCHHFYYHSRVGKVVGGVFEQQRTRLLGNFLPVIAQASLVISMDIAFTQWLFMCLMTRPVSVKCLDAAYSATSSLLFLFNWEMLRTLPEVSILALVLGLLTIPTSMVTPGTLFITQSQVPNNMTSNVPRLAIADPAQSNYFHVSRPAAGPNSPNNSSLLFLGPRTIISRLLVAAGAMGKILPLNAPAVNSSYHVHFFGPYVHCHEANDTVAGMIQSTINTTMGTNDNTTEIYNGYFAYVPDLSAPERYGNASNRTEDPTRSSNQLWLAFKRNGTAWDETVFPKCPITAYRVCQLYNTSYVLNVTFRDGEMSVGYEQPTNFTEVDYPVVDLSRPSDLVQLSYSAFMWAFTDLLVGSMGLYTDNLTSANASAWFNEIQTDIGNTALLGSSDLDCSFAVDWLFYGDKWVPPSPQRQQDIDFARNLPLEVLIPELSINLTISLMSDILLAPFINSSVVVTSVADLYDYHSLTLLSSYGAAIFVALIANILGFIAFRRNEVRVDKSFSWTASATQHTNLLDEEHYNRRGNIPIPPPIRGKRVVFQKIAGGGWGFKVVVREDEEDNVGGAEGGSAGKNASVRQKIRRLWTKNPNKWGTRDAPVKGRNALPVLQGYLKMGLKSKANG